MKNQMLLQVAEQQKSKLDQNMQDAFERIVLAGMDFLYKNDSTSAMSLKTITQAEDKPVAVGEGVATVMLVLAIKSRGRMPWEAGVLAGYALVCDALDFVEQKGMLKVDNAVTDTAMQAYGEKLMSLLHIDSGKVQRLAEQAQAHAQDPGIRAAYKQKFGQEIPQ